MGEEIQFSVVVAGKQVRFKRRLPAREGRNLIGLLGAISNEDLLSNVPVLTAIIETWDFPGDPATPEAYEELDTFTEFLPLVKAVNDHLTARTGAVSTKN